LGLSFVLSQRPLEIQLASRYSLGLRNGLPFTAHKISRFPFHLGEVVEVAPLRVRLKVLFFNLCLAAIHRHRIHPRKPYVVGISAGGFHYLGGVGRDYLLTQYVELLEGKRALPMFVTNLPGQPKEIAAHVGDQEISERSNPKA